MPGILRLRSTRLVHSWMRCRCVVSVGGENDEHQPGWPGDGLSAVKDEPRNDAEDRGSKRAAIASQGCSPEDPGDAREQSCRGSAARLKYNARKRERREERNSLVSALDQVLPHDVRSCDFRGAGTRSAGLLGRSITNVLADTVEYLKTLKEEDRSWPQGGARKRTSSPVKYRDGETISHGRPVRPAVLTPWRNAAACKPSSRARH